MEEALSAAAVALMKVLAVDLGAPVARRRSVSHAIQQPPSVAAVLALAFPPVHAPETDLSARRRQHSTPRDGEADS
jgi:hypothetical protein